MAYELLTWKAWAANATRDQVAEKLAMQQDEVVRLRAAVRVLAEYVASVEAGASVATICHHQEMCDANPIAAAAVREAGR